MAEPFGLGGDAACDFLDVARDIRELNPKAADSVRELVDQAFGIRRGGHGAGRGALYFNGLRDRHRRTPLNKTDSPGEKPIRDLKRPGILALGHEIMVNDWLRH